MLSCYSMEVFIGIVFALALTGCASQTEHIKYNAPSEKFIDIEGNIEDGLVYKEEVLTALHGE